MIKRISNILSADLPPGGSFSIHKKSDPQFTGRYQIINADMIYKGELRQVDKLTGEIDFTGEKQSDVVVGYFAHIEMVDGFAKTLYIT